jgi:hypothetical protein
MAGNTSIDNWVEEDIPNDNMLYMRVHENHVQNGKLMPAAFRNHPTPQDGMSTDWNKYSTPQETKNRGKKPEQNGVVKMLVQDVRNIDELIVRHTPDIPNKNRAHTDVFGPKDEERRTKLRRIYSWVTGFAIQGNL